MTVVIRKYQEVDIEERYNAIRDSLNDLSKWFAWCHPAYMPEENRAWFVDYEQRWKNGNEFSFKISEGTSRTQLGECRINHINRLHKFANISYWVRSGYEGRGIATSAVLQTARFGFTELGVHRLEIFMSLRNAASRKVAEKVGATMEGTLRNRIDLRGRVEDAVLYSLIPDDVLD